eukprot:TRINITY_DN2189_c0_g1_i7.p1 TRINITY_DN2189_c0_g1~~TRINITY_DN2189_c0_g1_i7.p1  ORF type:complete len:580 (-),score=127.45 TRINITY_DN2189_c0_g1_i7:147-1886(-)
MILPERILAKYLKQVAVGEKSVERARRELAQEKLFTPETAFASLDRSCKGYLCLNDLFQFLKYFSLCIYRNNNVSVTKEDCIEILRTYDTTHTHSLYYADFLHLTLPNAQRLASMVLERSKETKGTLSFQVKKRLLDLLRAELLLWRELRELYEELRKRPDFGLYHMFHFMDPECDYYLKPERVHEFMSNQGEKLSMEEIRSVLKRLDTGHDGRTSYLDFKYSITGDDSPVTLEEPHAQKREGVYKPMETPQKKSSTLVGKYVPIEEASMIKSGYEIGSREKNESFKTPEKDKHYISTAKTYETPIEERKAKAVQSSEMASRLTASQSPEVRGFGYSSLKRDELLSGGLSNWEGELAKVFKSQLLIDSELEAAKAELCSKPDFTLSNAFAYFDCKGMGSLALYEMKRGLSKLGIKYTDESLMLLMKRYDLDTNGSLSYFEFAKMLSPVIASPLPDVEASTVHEGQIKFATETKRVFINVLRSLLRTETIAETIRSRAREVTDNLQEAFARCDAEGKGFVTKQDLHEFMLRNDMDVREINGSLLMNRYDKDVDERITLREVVWLVIGSLCMRLQPMEARS